MIKVELDAERVAQKLKLAEKNRIPFSKEELERLVKKNALCNAERAQAELNINYPDMKLQAQLDEEYFMTIRPTAGSFLPAAVVNSLTSFFDKDKADGTYLVEYKNGEMRAWRVEKLPDPPKKWYQKLMFWRKS